MEAGTERLTLEELRMLAALLEQRINSMLAEAARSPMGESRRKKWMKIFYKIVAMERSVGG